MAPFRSEAKARKESSLTVFLEPDWVSADQVMVAGGMSEADFGAPGRKGFGLGGVSVIRFLIGVID